MKTINNIFLILSLALTSQVVDAYEVYHSTTKEAKELISLLLKDSESARWGKISLSPLKSYACVSVNSKNSYGAYEGIRHYALIKQKPGNPFQQFGAASYTSHEDCLYYISGIEYNQTPEGRKKLAKEEFEAKQRDEAMWKEIEQKSKQESLQREQAEKASWEEYQAKTKQQEQEAQLKYQEERRIRDEEEKVLIEKYKQESATANQPFNAIADTIKTLESLKNMF